MIVGSEPRLVEEDATPVNFAVFRRPAPTSARARASLADCPWTEGKRAGAIDHCMGRLSLNRACAPVTRPGAAGQSDTPPSTTKAVPVA